MMLQCARPSMSALAAIVCRFSSLVNAFPVTVRGAADVCGQNASGENPGLGLDQLLERRMSECYATDVNGFSGSCQIPDRYPYAVSLRKPQSGDHYCSGALIAPNKVLTAAHCISDRRKGYGHTNPKVRIDAMRPKAAVQVGTLSSETHPRWTGNIAGGYDIAVITLDQAVWHQPVKLADPTTQLQDGKGLQSLGWGTDWPERDLSPTDPKSDRVVFLPNAECRQTYADLVGADVVSENTLCAFQDEGRWCRADPGSPLVIRDESGRPALDVLVGVASVGVSICERNRDPAIFSSVFKLYDFVKKHLDSAAPPVAPLVSPPPTSGCHFKNQVTWRFSVCFPVRDQWQRSMMPRFLALLEDKAGLRPESVAISRETATTPCPCDLNSPGTQIFHTIVTAVLSTYDDTEAEKLSSFVQEPSSILNPAIITNPNEWRDCSQRCTKSLDVTPLPGWADCF